MPSSDENGISLPEFHPTGTEPLHRSGGIMALHSPCPHLHPWGDPAPVPRGVAPNGPHIGRPAPYPVRQTKHFVIPSNSFLCQNVH